jgi:hypothetical protein
VSLVSEVSRLFHPASLKIGICPVYKNSDERDPTSDFDWLDWRSWEAV